MPFNLLQQWINEEKSSGAPNPMHAVLSTVTKEGTPDSRIVAIREITEKSLVFFTQKNTKKVRQLQECNSITLSFWLELWQREVIIYGKTSFLSAEENERYWSSYPPAAQIRFASYAPTSGQIIPAKHLLEQKRAQLAAQFSNHQLPLHPLYCGIQVIPDGFVFYAYRTDELSDVITFSLKDNQWDRQLLSP